MIMHLIRLKNMSFSRHDGGEILHDINLELNEGDRLGLSGPNGGGKTTLLHILVGLLIPTKGEVEIFGNVCTSERDFMELRRKVQLLFQDPEDQLFSPTVFEDVVFGPLNVGKTREEAADLARDSLASLGLSGYENKIIHHLSGGEKRLVSLAGVLAMKPRVLLLDEPETGLDETSCERLIDILIHLPVAMIVVSHNRQFLERIVTSGVKLRNGTLEDWEMPKKVYRHLR